jgi:hypothetical protein
MSRDESQIDRALSRRRRMIAIFAVILMSAQGGVLAATEQITLNGGRAVDQFRAGAFVLLALAFMLFLLTGGRGARRHPELNDELVRANRAGALKLGYVSLMLALIGVYVAMLLTPLDVSKFLPLFIAFGIVVPAMRFALLERIGTK